MTSTIRLMTSKGDVRTFEVHRIPTKKTKIEMVQRVDDHILGISRETGRLYSVDRFPTKNVSFCGWTWHFLIPFAKALHSFGVISKEDLQANIEKVAEETETRDKEMEVSSLRRSCAELGITLTKAQEKKL